jgi:hypothetical protein
MGMEGSFKAKIHLNTLHRIAGPEIAGLTRAFFALPLAHCLLTACLPLAGAVRGC